MAGFFVCRFLLSFFLFSFLVVIFLFLYGGYTEGREEMFYLTTHSTHFIHGCAALNIWQGTTQIAREKTQLTQLHWQLFPISGKSYFICTTPQTGKHIP